MLTQVREKELKQDLKKFGIAGIRARLANPGVYDQFEAPYIKGLIEDHLSKFLRPVDIIMIILTIISISVAIMFGNHNRQLEDQKQLVHNKALLVQQFTTNNNYNVPKNVIEAADLIVSGTAPSGQVIIEK